MLHPQCWATDLPVFPSWYGYPGSYPYVTPVMPVRQVYYRPYSPQRIAVPRSEGTHPEHTAGISKAGLLLNQTFRTLWEQHVAWTRMLIISIAEELGDEQAVTERLLRNAPDMAEVFRRYYGDEIASQFNKLFTEHLVVASELVKAAKAGDQKAAADAEARWYANADELATFLNRINPYWPKSVVLPMLQEHLKMTKEQAVQRLNKNYKADIEIYDQIEKQALEMADAFTTGLMRQFPGSF